MVHKRKAGPTAYWVQGKGPAIVFVHGNGSTHDTWQGVIEYLTDDFSCISYDLRGHGNSDPAPDELTLDRLVEDLEALRTELSLEQAFFVGHSLGSFIAAAYAHRYPEHVSRLCLMAAPVDRNEQDIRSNAKLIERLQHEGVAETMSSLVKLWYTDAFVTVHPGALQQRLEQLTSINEQVFIDTYKLYSQTEIGLWLNDIAMPTLIMTGEYAKGSGADVAKHLSDIVEGSKLIIFKEMKNGILTEIPDRVAKELDAFYRTAHNTVASPL